MTVTINKTDGTVLTTIADGAVDTSSTNLALIGRLYRNYGELVNENLVKMLENFAATSSPTIPIVGQLWYNKTAKNIQVYRDTGFVPLARISSSSAEPSNPSIADLWWDLTDEQIRMYNGATWINIAPAYTASQGKTGMFAETIQDVTTANHIAAVVYQQGQQISIFSRDPVYTPLNAITGFSTVAKGVNLSTISDFKLHGTATNAELLDSLDSAQFVRSDIADDVAGILTFSDDGLVIGADDDITIDVTTTVGSITKATGTLQVVMGTDVALVVNQNEQLLVKSGSVTNPSVGFQSDDTTGIFSEADGASFDITVQGVKQLTVDTGVEVYNDLQVDGDLTVNGNLLVKGDTTLGDEATDLITFVGNTLSIPNGLTIVDGDVAIDQDLTVGGTMTLGATNLVGDFAVTGATVLNGTLSVTPTDANDFKIDSLARVMINATTPAVGYTNEGDVTMGATNGIFARNVPKYVVTFDGSLAGLAVLKSHQIATVTRTSAGHYSITLRDDFATNIPLISAYPTVIGSTNGTSSVGKNGTSSIGDTSINVQTSTGLDYTQISVAIWDGAN